MKTIAFVFMHAPHGSSHGREGLDAALAASAVCNMISLFFIGDGVLQIINNQQPDKILARNYITTFGVLSLYDVTDCYLCAQSLSERGLTIKNKYVLDAKILDNDELLVHLAKSDYILTF